MDNRGKIDKHLLEPMFEDILTRAANEGKNDFQNDLVSFATTEESKCNEEQKDLPNQSVSSDGTEQELEMPKYDEQKKEFAYELDSSPSKRRSIQIPPEDLDKYLFKGSNQDMCAVLEKLGVTSTTCSTKVLISLGVFARRLLL